MIISAKTRNALVFFSALFLLTIGGGLTYLTILRLADSERWVNHTHEVQTVLSTINPVISRAGRSRVEYVQSGDPARLEEYQSAVADIQRTLAQVRRLTADNRIEQINCDRLENLAGQRIGVMDRAIELKRSGESNLQNEAEITQQVVGIAAEMDGVVRKMQAEEDRLLAERQARSKSLFRLAVLLFSAAFLVAVLLLSLHYSLLNRELKGRQSAEESLRRLNARLLEIQDDERRKISQELHESLGQHLSGVKIKLEILGKSLPPNPLLGDCVNIIDKSIAETRNMSHLLHPPLLDEIGFASAARWYVEGFAERSGISVDIRLPDKLRRLPSSIELALFRVLQESLTNIYRHSGSRKAQLIVLLRANEIELQVKDDGKGMTAGVLQRFESNTGYLGVGLTGMRERLRELGGRMEVQSNAQGTRIAVVLPITPASEEKPVGAQEQAKRLS